MRPRELTLAGFRSYREPTTFDLRGRHLVGVVGPIGSGKSSLLDAVTFALYGKTPTFERETRSLINQRLDDARVQLTFEVDGQTWRVTRAIRRKGQSQHKLELLAHDDADAEVLETVVQERATRDRVVQLLGLDFDAFCRSVMLAQNRFAEFLKATPTQRNDVLKGVFGFERFDRALAVAKERAAAAEGERVAIEDEGRRLIDARASLKEAAAEAAEAAARAARFEERRERVGELDTTLAAAEAARLRSAESTLLLERIAGELPDGVKVDALLDAAGAAGARVEAAAATAHEAEAATVSAEAVRDAVSASAAEVRAFADLVAKLDATAAAVGVATEAVARSDAAVRTAEGAVRVADAAVADAEGTVAVRDVALADAQAAQTSADEALHEARHAGMAVELRRELVRGEPCPVCAQAVNAPPPIGRAPAIARAEAAARRTEAAVVRARDGREGAAAALAAAVARAGGATTAHEVALDDRERAATEAADREAELAAIKSELVDRLGEGDPRGLIAERERELADAEAALRAASADASSARDALGAAREAAEAAIADVARLAARLTGSWGRLGESTSVEPAPDAVRASFVELGETIVSRLGDETAERTRAAEAADLARAELATELEAVGLSPGEDFGEARSEARANAAAAAQRVQGLEAIIAAAADLEARLDAVTARRDVARRIASDLQPSRLLAFALEEERAALAEIGSVHFEELSGGAYRFADDDTFAVADVNAGGAVRSSDSLSGGETFLASLALALALAEMVARGGGRLDAFFLDEGFGSLDPEHLERAMDGIGRLVAGGEDRLVVLVSHVEQMRSMLEDLIELDRDDRTGDTRVIAGATGSLGAG
jgi:exonuclease SbcC